MRQGRPPATGREAADGTGSAADERCKGDDARMERTKRKRQGKVRKMLLRSDGARGYSAPHSESFSRRLIARRHGTARTDHGRRRQACPAIYPDRSDIFGRCREEIPSRHVAVAADARTRLPVGPGRMQRRVGNGCCITLF
jgi:hypothetical protein